MLKFNLNHRIFMNDNQPSKYWSDEQLSGILQNQRSQHRLTPGEFRPIGENIKSIAKKIKITSKSKTQQIEAAWKTVFTEINPSLARNSEIVSFRSGVLHVAIKSSTIFFELQHFHTENILKRLREVCKYPVLELKLSLKK